MDRARLIKIIVFITGILLLAVAVFLVFFNKGTRVINRPQPTDISKIPFDGTGATPISGSTNPDGQTPTGPNATPVIETTETIGKFKKLSTGPVAGYISRQTQKTIIVPIEATSTSDIANLSTEEKAVLTKTIVKTVPTIRYTDARNGFVYDAEIDETEITRTQITDTFIANVAEAVFDGPSKVALRYVNPQTEEIQTYDGSIPEKKPAEKVCRGEITDDLKKGTKGDQVITLQTFLAYLDGAQSKADGSFGPATEASVKRFQAKNTLAETGIMSTEMRAVFNRQCAETQAILDKKALEPVSITGSFMGQTILQMIPLQKTGVFMLSKTQNGSKGITRVAGKTSDVFTSALTEWLPYDIGKGSLVMAVKPSGLVDGFAYFYNTATQTYTKITGGVKGLTVLPNSDGSKVLLGGIIQDKGLRLGLYDNKTKSIQTSQVATLPEKCTFAGTATIYCGVPQQLPAATYPDDWYKGSVGFTDTLTKTNIDTGTTVNLEVPNGIFSFDYTQMSIDQSGRYLLFVDKKTGALWSYDTQL